MAKSLPQWTLLHIIGKGGSSIVYKSEPRDDPPTLSGKYVAIKQIDTDAMNKVQVQGIQAEIETMKALCHPNIVKYFSMQELSNRIYIVMEYAAFGSLRQFYQRHGALQAEEVVFCLNQIVQGLAYLHSQGIAHRDIKCANCLLFEGEQVKLADFGASKKYESESIVSGLKGTPNWMAPEVIKGTAMTVGWMKADVWSLGCSIVEMLTAKIPYAEYDNPVTAMFRIASGEPPRWTPLEHSPLTDGLQQFLSQCCAVNLDERPTVELLQSYEILQSDSTYTPGRLFAYEVLPIGTPSSYEHRLEAGDMTNELEPCQSPVESIPSLPSEDSLQPSSPVLELQEEILVPDPPSPDILTPALYIRPVLAPVSLPAMMTRQFSGIDLSRESTACASYRGSEAARMGLSDETVGDYEDDFLPLDPEEMEEEDRKGIVRPKPNTEVVSLLDARPRAPLTGERLDPAWHVPSVLISQHHATLPPVKEGRPKASVSNDNGHNNHNNTTPMKSNKARASSNRRPIKERDQKEKDTTPARSSSVTIKANRVKVSLSKTDDRTVVSCNSGSVAASTSASRSVNLPVSILPRSIRSFSAGPAVSVTSTTGVSRGLGRAKVKARYSKNQQNLSSNHNNHPAVKLPSLAKVAIANNDAIQTTTRIVQSAPAVSRSVNLPALQQRK